MAVNIGPRIGIDGEAEYRKQINNIIQDTKTLKSEYEALTSQFDKGKQSLSQNRDMHRILGEEIDAQKGRVERLKDMVEKSAEKFGEADPKTQRWKQALNEANGELSTLERDLENLPSDLELIGSKFQEVGNQISDAGKKMKGWGRSFAPISTAAAGIVVGASKSFMDFEHQMSRVKAISGASTEEFQLLTDKAKEMGATTKYTSEEAGQAFEYMAMAGWKAEDMMAGIGPIMDLASASGEELATTSDIVTDALTAFGLKAEDTAYFTDVLASAATNSNTNVSMLGESFKYIAPLAGSMGYDIDDMATALGLLANNGIKADMAGTTLRNLITRMVKPTKESDAAMTALGISMENVATGEMYSFGEILDQLRDKLGGLNQSEVFTSEFERLNKELADGVVSEEQYDEQLQELVEHTTNAEDAEKARLAAMLAGSRGMSGLLAIVNASEEDYQKLKGAIDDSAGAAHNMAETMENDTAGAMTKAMSALNNSLIEFGEKFAPIIQEIAKAITDLSNQFSALDDDTKKKLAGALIAIAALSPAIIGISKVVQIVGSVITTVTAIASGGVATILAGIAGIGVAIAAVIDMVKNGWSLISSVIEAIGLALATVAVVIVAGISGIGIAIAAAVAATVFAITQAIILIKDHWTEIMNFFKGVVDHMAARWKALCAALGTQWQNICNTVKNLWSGVTNTLSGFFNTLQTRFSNTINNLQNGFTNFVRRATGWGRDLMDNFIDGIRSMWDRLVDTVSDIADTIADYLGFSEPEKGPLSNFHTYAPDMMKLFAKGIKDNENVIQSQIERSFDFSGLATEAFTTQATPYAYIPDTTTNNSVSIGSTQIVINATEGQSVYEIADAVDEIINQRYQRAQAAWA